MAMVTRQVTHYVVTCVVCGHDSVVCPRRATDLGAWERAVRAFESAGWHQDVDQSRRSHGRNDVRDHGGGRWYCPECAKRRP
jgi:hypothetical protein